MTLKVLEVAACPLENLEIQFQGLENAAPKRGRGNSDQMFSLPNSMHGSASTCLLTVSQLVLGKMNYFVILK